MMKKYIALLLALAMLCCASALAVDLPHAPSGRFDISEIDAPEDEALDISEFAVTEGLPNDWVNILLLGSDSRTEGKYGDTDSIIILSVNPATKQAKMTSLMRDIWVTMDGRSKSGKLNSACAQGGPSLAMRTINECFGMNIQYYALVNLDGMAEIIDILGGLDLDITAEELTALNKGLFNLSPLSGMETLNEYGSDVHVNGNQAAAYARIRNIDSDTKRTERQRYVLTQIGKRLQQETAATIVGVVMKLLECVETNMDLTQLMTIAAVGMEVDMNNVPQLRLPAEDTYESGSYIIDKRRIHCLKVDFTANSLLLRQFIYI